MTMQAEQGKTPRSPWRLGYAEWKAVLWRVVAQISEDRLLLVAAGITFYVLLAFVPATSALVSVYGLMLDPAKIADQVQKLQGVLPGGALEILEEQIKRLVGQGSATLGLTFAAGLAIALWSANAGVKALFDGMNIVYAEHEKRSFLTLNAITLGFTLGGVLVLVALLGLLVALPVALKLAALGPNGELAIRVASYLALGLILSTGIAAVYRWGPSREGGRWQWITPGALLASVVWICGSVLFSWYVANFGSFNATYGSLGALIGFMTWVWLSMIILLVGAELNAELSRENKREITTKANN